MLPQLFSRHRDDIDTVVDASFEFHRDDDDFLATLYPVVEVSDWQYITGLLDYQTPIAYVLGDDGEIPSAIQSMDFRQFAESFARVGLSDPYDAKRLINLIELANRLPDASTLATLFFQPQGRLIDSVMELRKLLAMQQIFNLNIDYFDPRTEARISLDLRSLGDESLFPAPLTGNARWSQRTTARGLEDIDRLNGAYFDVNEEYPDDWLLSRKQMQNLLRQDSTRAYIQDMMGTTVSAGALSIIPTAAEQMLTVLNNVLGLQGMNNGQAFPTLRVVDKTVRRQISSNRQETERYRVVPDNAIAAVKRNPDTIITPSGNVTNAMGLSVFGPNLESAIAELAADDIDIEQIINRMSPRPFVWASKIHDAAFAVKCVANLIPLPIRPKTYSSQVVDGLA